MFKKIVYIVVIFLIAFFGFKIMKAKKQASTHKNCDSAIVSKRDIVKTIKVNAKLKSSNYADISTEIPTLVKWVGVEVNDKVKKGDILVRLDKATISAQIRNLKLAVEKAELAEQEGRLKSKHLSGKQKLSLKKSSQQARERLNEAYAQSSKTIIRAPIDGVVIKKNVNSGEVASGVLIRVIDTNSLQIEALIPEVDMKKVKEGQKVKANFDAYPEIDYEGIIKTIEMGGSELQGNTYYKAIIEITDFKNNVLLEGMNADVIIPYENKKNALSVPRDFAKKDDKGYFIFEKVTTKGEVTFVKKYFKEGLKGDKNLEVLDKLVDGQSVSKNCNK